MKTFWAAAVARRAAATAWSASRPLHAAVSGSRGIAALVPRMSHILCGGGGLGFARSAAPPTIALGCGLPGLRPAAVAGAVAGWGTVQVRGMRHGMVRHNLSRSPKRRKHMLRNLVTDLIMHERILTTMARAKALKRWADWMITMGKQRTLSSRRRAQAVLRKDEALIKLFSTLAERYKDRKGGYTRVLRHRLNRAGDNAPMAFIEYVDRPGEMRECRPPASQLPYSKMLARAEQEGDELLAEYYRKEQQYVLANAERRTQRLKKNALMSGAKDSKWSRAMAEVGYVGPNSREKALATRLAAEEEAAQGAVEDNQPQKKKQQQ